MPKKRVQVTFTEKQWSIINEFRGEFGESDADIVRNIVISWLSEKSIISSKIKTQMEFTHENQP